MSKPIKTDCGHACCEQRTNAYHAHAVGPDDCQICETVRDTGRIPTVTIDEPTTTEKADRDHVQHPPTS